MERDGERDGEREMEREMERDGERKTRLALKFTDCLGVTAKKVFIEPGSLTASESRHIDHTITHKGAELLRQHCN